MKKKARYEIQSLVNHMRNNLSRPKMDSTGKCRTASQYFHRNSVVSIYIKHMETSGNKMAELFETLTHVDNFSKRVLKK